jgi:hypothetical protein
MIIRTENKNWREKEKREKKSRAKIPQHQLLDFPNVEANITTQVWDGGRSRSGCMAKAYLLIFGSRVDDVVHQYGEKLSHSSHTGGKCAIGSTTTRQLTDLAGLVYPLSGYRVYDIQDPQLVCSWCFFEMCVDLLDEDGFGLRTSKRGSVMPYDTRTG